MTGYIDSHFHARYIQDKGIDIVSHFAKLFTAGFSGGLDIGIEPDDLPKRQKLLKIFDKVDFAAGIYPGFAEKASASQNPSITIIEYIENLKTTIQDAGIAAVGEIGLDYHWDYGTPKLQTELFINQIELANNMNLPILIHNRDADTDMVEAVRNNPPNMGGILHCFSANYKIAKEMIDLGFLISFAGNITYNKNDELRSVLRKIPSDAIMLETDSPYLSPIPKRGKINTPENMPYIYQAASEITGLATKELLDIVFNNYKRIITNSIL